MPDTWSTPPTPAEQAAAFDLDAYLAAKRAEQAAAFDPEKYLAEKRAEMRVTNPALLAKLEGGGKVTDPALLRQLDDPWSTPPTAAEKNAPFDPEKYLAEKRAAQATQPTLLHRAIAFMSTPFAESINGHPDPLIERQKQLATERGPGLVGKDSGNVVAGAGTFVSAMPGYSRTSENPETTQRLAQFAQENPGSSLLLRLGGGMAAPVLPSVKVADPVLEQIARVRAAAPAAQATEEGGSMLPDALEALAHHALPAPARFLLRALKRSAPEAPPPLATQVPVNLGRDAAEAAPEIANAAAARPSPAAAAPASPSEALLAAAARRRESIMETARAASDGAPSAAPALAPAVAPVAEAPEVAGNAFEAAARAAKVKDLIRAIDANAMAHLGADVTLPEVADAVAKMPREWWQGMAKIARINAPSDTTIADAADFLRARAAASQSIRPASGH